MPQFKKKWESEVRLIKKKKHNKNICLEFWSCECRTIWIRKQKEEKKNFSSLCLRLIISNFFERAPFIFEVISSFLYFCLYPAVSRSSFQNILEHLDVFCIKCPLGFCPIVLYSSQLPTVSNSSQTKISMNFFLSNVSGETDFVELTQIYKSIEHKKILWERECMSLKN